MSSSSPTCSELLAEAIGSPEPGVLNFTALLQLLQAILRKLDIEDVPVEQIRSPGADLQPEPPVQPQQQCTVPVEIERFEESEAYLQLLSRVDELQNSVGDLKAQLTEQKRISDAVLPSTEQLERFQSSRTSSLHPAHESSVDLLSLAARFDTIDDTVGRLSSLANDTVLEYARIEKSLLPYLDGGELAIIRGQLDNINQLLKTHFPDYRSHCSSVSLLQSTKSSQVREAVPMDFYQHSVPDTIKALVPRRSTIQHVPVPSVDFGRELDTIRAVLTGLIARLPLLDAEISDGNSSRRSCSSTLIETPSVEMVAESIRSVWPRELEELLNSNHERIEALERTQQTQRQQLDAFEQRDNSLENTLKQLSQRVESHHETVTEQLRVLEQDLAKKLSHLNERFRAEQLEMGARICELEQQLENRVDFEQFQTRLSKDTFHRTVKELQFQIDGRVEQFTAELQLMWSQLDTLDRGLQEKSSTVDLEGLEGRLRRRLNFMQLLVYNLQAAVQKTVEAAGTRVRLGPEKMRCVSCNHEATMQAFAELIPTGKTMRMVEQEREQRIRQLNKLASKIALRKPYDEPMATGKQPKPKSTVKADMVQPAELAYKVHAKKRYNR